MRFFLRILSVLSCHSVLILCVLAADATSPASLAAAPPPRDWIDPTPVTASSGSRPTKAAPACPSTKTATHPKVPNSFSTPARRCSRHSQPDHARSLAHETRDRRTRHPRHRHGLAHSRSLHPPRRPHRCPPPRHQNRTHGHQTPQVAQGRGGAYALNCDEFLLVGIASDPDGKRIPRTPPTSGTGGTLKAQWAAGTPKMIYTIDVKTGAFRVIHRENDWTNHLQCPPTDALQILFCHQGPWHFNDRTWTARADGTPARLLHERTMNMEIEGHEFFSPDGKKSGTTSRPRAAPSSGSPTLTSPAATADGIASNAKNGPCIMTSPLTVTFSPAMVAVPAAWPRAAAMACASSTR